MVCIVQVALWNYIIDFIQTKFVLLDFLSIN